MLAKFIRPNSTLHRLLTLEKRREERARKMNVPHESMNEREFIRSFGSKAKSVRYSGRPDFVGLVVRGDRLGFMVVKHGDHRRVRFIMFENGKWVVTKRYIPLRNDDSLSDMQRGLLRNVA